MKSWTKQQLKEVWKERSVYKPGEMLTDDLLFSVETSLNLSLPNLYKQLMKIQNGGELAVPIYPSEELPYVIHYLQEIELEKGVGLSDVFIEEFHLPNGLILITGDLFSWLAFDYRTNLEEPCVVFFYEEDGVWREIEVAETFEQFIGLFIQYEESKKPFN
ncbi:SMI1/KNR4 family protein [Alkalihalobacillus sp. 1P02AB]|uniref:SMI1/KNR4 family protein n=1 Tax=Alkalihalobacillus sp. 1P02AB TaxID=3132260 RepID=UPI0039A545A0